jgi:hypothetical protein
VSDVVTVAKSKGVKAKVPSPLPLATKAVAIDADCTGDRWNVQDEAELAKFVAIIAMGQAKEAARILAELASPAPAYVHEALIAEAKRRLTVQDDDLRPRTGYPRQQRDGYMFEMISWIAARQTHGTNAYLKDPHHSATIQGLDGLMIEVEDATEVIVRTTIFEDKCTDHPRSKFLKVMEAFSAYHRNERAVELVAGASALLHTADIKEDDVARTAAAVMDRGKRRYRAAFALTKAYDDVKQRQSLFKGYAGLDGLSKDQRIGASLIVDGKMRAWFDALALKAIAYLDKLQVGGPNV